MRETRQEPEADVLGRTLALWKGPVSWLGQGTEGKTLRDPGVGVA